MPSLKKLMEDETGGDPISGVKWSRRSTRNLERALRDQGHQIGKDTVGRLLRDQGFSLKANVKKLSGRRHPNREQQFEMIGQKTRSFRRLGLPVVSVDAKKKEIIANYHNGGRIWTGEPITVADHDFPSPNLGRAIPYGIYEVVRNRGTVVVGTSAETAAFGVDALRMWYRREGRRAYPDADKLLVLCDNGGCNGSRNRLWKRELQEFADEFDLAVQVAHYPPGASKWNPIEHRLFSFISKNWAGRPLRNYETVLNYIRTTRTQTGLTVRAHLLKRSYTKGVKVTDDEIADLNLRAERALPEWNYIIRPRPN